MKNQQKHVKLDYDEVIEKLVESLRGMDGKELADLYNREFGEGMIYLGDDTFRHDTESAEETAEAEDEEIDLDIRYRCPKCGYTWEEQWPSACDSECGECGTDAIEALMWKDQDDEWSKAQDKEWADCDKCECGHAPGDHHKGRCQKKRCGCKEYKPDMSRYQTAKEPS